MDLINGSGYDQADLMIVGDYARKADETARECLSGFYSRKISEYLSDSGINISHVYKTCAVKLYAVGLGVGTWAQDRKILGSLHELYGLPAEYWSNILLDEINTIKPQVIVAMGEYALNTLTGKWSITNFRGSILPLKPELALRITYQPLPKIVVTQHPNIVHTQEEQHYLLRMDFEKATELLFNPLKKLDDYEIVIARDFPTYLRFRESYPTNPEWMTTDVETHMGFITCVSFTFDGKRALTIPMFGSNVSKLELARMLHFYAKDCLNPLIQKNNQNINFDKHQLERFRMPLVNIKWDTMIAASVISPEFPKRLGFLTSIYCDAAYHKDEGKEFDPAKHSFDQLYIYCGKDSITTHRIMFKQMEDLDGLEAREFYEHWMIPWLNMYYNIESVGILQDPVKQRQLLAKYEAMKCLKRMELDALTGEPLRNLAYQAVGNYMDVKGFPVYRHRSKDSAGMIVNTDAESLRKMRAKKQEEYRKCGLHYDHALRFINLILMIRRIDKIIEAIETKVHPDGRIRCSIKLGGTAGGRTSNGQSSDRDWYWDEDKKGKTVLEYDNLGTSLQTVTKHGFIIEGEDGEDDDIDDGIIGKDIREMYKADPGWLLMEYDRSQAEARVVDLLCEDYEGLEEYGKIDKHSKNAALIFSEFTYEDIRRMYKEGNDEGAFMRQLGKKGVHATNYDMGDFRFSNLANIPIQLAHDILVKIHKAKPWIRDVFHKGVADELRKSRRLDNPMGRPRMFYKKLDTHGIKVGYSWYPQSTISDTTKRAMLRTYDEMDKTRAFLVAENHDSITALVRCGYAHRYHHIITNHLTEGIDFRKGTFYRDYNLVIPCEGSFSRTNWGQMNTLKKIRL